MVTQVADSRRAHHRPRRAALAPDLVAGLSGVEVTSAAAFASSLWIIYDRGGVLAFSLVPDTMLLFALLREGSHWSFMETRCLAALYLVLFPQREQSVCEKKSSVVSGETFLEAPRKRGT